MPRARTRVPKLPGSEPAAFLNIPYDDDFGDLFLSYIAGLAAFGLTPRATLGIPGGARRLDRILELIESCQYSFHDLSRVELDATNPPTPRFNMPFELGIAVTWERLHRDQHVWFVLETKNRRALKSLSDLAGTYRRAVSLRGPHVQGVGCCGGQTRRIPSSIGLERLLRTGRGSRAGLEKPMPEFCLQCGGY